MSDEKKLVMFYIRGSDCRHQLRDMGVCGLVGETGTHYLIRPKLTSGVSFKRINKKSYEYVEVR